MLSHISFIGCWQRVCSNNRSNFSESLRWCSTASYTRHGNLHVTNQQAVSPPERKDESALTGYGATMQAKKLTGARHAFQALDRS